MKLRIKGDSIRLRLTQSEVKVIGEGGAVVETTHFQPGVFFKYKLEASEETREIRTLYAENTLTLQLPWDVARQWTSTDMVSLKCEQPNGQASALFILVEKDFFCLKPREHQMEDESDMHVNPNAAHGSCGGAGDDHGG